jgi:leucyl/phenylalanyl-tRNA--protein transferase
MLKNFSIKSIDLEKNFPIIFPDVAQALLEPNGLLASGGELNPDWLLSAYQQGIFPWYNPDEPILWWSPDPRYGFSPGKVHLSKSRIRQIRKSNWVIRADSQFELVIRQCANVARKGQAGTWISEDMILAYCELYNLGYAHSIEVFDAEQLVGGLYGLAIGQMFYAESMFSLKSQASALALFALSQKLASWHWPWIDTQIENPHLKLLGGNSISRAEFMQILEKQLDKPPISGSWSALFSNIKPE